MSSTERTIPSRAFMVQQAVLCALVAEMPAKAKRGGPSEVARWFLAHTSIAEPIWNNPRQHFFGRQVCNQFRAIAAEYGVQVAA